MRANSASRRRSGRRQRSALRSFVTILQVGVLAGVGILAGLVLGWFANVSKTTLPEFNTFKAPEATLVYSADGVMLGRLYRENRTNVPLKDIPKYLTSATIAIEDKRFYEHSGVDLRGVARAIFTNVRGGRMRQGGSTITQQLARNVFLTQQRTMQRKVQEMFLAILVERNFSKDRILELYLNQVFYGSGAFGVQAAARVYFGKDVHDLDLSQCALLAGLPQQPTGMSPHHNLDAALARRNTVLEAMVEQGYISPQEQHAAKTETLRIIPRKQGRNAYLAPQFVDYVTRQLRELYGDDVLGGGLRVYTTLNYKMQEAAENALREGVKRYERTSKPTEGCLIAVDPTNGAILAMVGSVDPKSEFNRCTQAGRQPGSSFKAFVYTAALESGMKITDRLPNVRHPYPAGGGKWWNPKNYDSVYTRPVTMERAVAKSINMAAIYTAHKVGVKNVIKYARLMGIHSPLEPYLPIAIGGIPGVHPIEMASAYGTFANDGAHVEPIAITRITNSRNETQEDFPSDAQQVISKEVSSQMDHMFRAVVNYGTGTVAGAIANARGKTGTTNNDVDAWFVGYVPKKIVCAVWVGYDNYAPMNHASGGHWCAPIWRDFMYKAIPIYDRIKIEAEQKAQAAKPKSDTEQQPTGQPQTTTDQTTNATQPDVTATETGDTIKRRICTDSGLLATKNCPTWRTRTFTKGSEPTAYCNIHPGTEMTPATDGNAGATASPQTDYVTVSVCAESGMLAGRNCPRVVKRRFPVNEVPTQICNFKHDVRE